MNLSFSRIPGSCKAKAKQAGKVLTIYAPGDDVTIRGEGYSSALAAHTALYPTLPPGRPGGGRGGRKTGGSGPGPETQKEKGVGYGSGEGGQKATPPKIF